MEQRRTDSLRTSEARRAKRGRPHERDWGPDLRQVCSRWGKVALLLAVATFLAVPATGRAAPRNPPPPGHGTTVHPPPPQGPPLQPVGIGPMWDMSVTGPWPNNDWQDDPQFTAHVSDGERINVPSPTTDFQFKIAYTDNTPNMADSGGNVGDFASYWATIEECLTTDEAQGLSYYLVSPQESCSDADHLPGQWYTIATNPQLGELAGSSADPNSYWLQPWTPSHQAAPGSTVTDTLTTEAKLPKIANVVRFYLGVDLNESRVPCYPDSYNCANHTDHSQAQTSGPVEVVVIPAAAIQLRLLPYTILYAPPGSNSTSDFKTTSTFGLEMTVGNDTALEHTTEHDAWLQQGETDQANLSVSMGAEGIGITAKPTYDFSQSVRWDSKSSATAGQTQSAQEANGYSVSTTAGTSVGPGGSADMSQIPGRAGSYANAPFLNDRIVMFRHPQLAVWDFDGKASVQMMGARGTPQAVDWVTLVLSDLGACANGKLKLNIAPSDEPAEILTADECQAMASLDPFYGWGQSANLTARGGQPILSDFYGMPEQANSSSEPDTLNLQDVTKYWQKATQTNRTTYASSVMAVEATEAGSGLTMGASAQGGEGQDVINLGFSQDMKVSSGETDGSGGKMTITYTNATATTTEQDWTIDGTISDRHTNLVDPVTSQPYRPYVEVYQDRDFGGFMYRDPGAPKACLYGPAPCQTQGVGGLCGLGGCASSPQPPGLGTGCVVAPGPSPSPPPVPSPSPAPHASIPGAAVRTATPNTAATDNSVAASSSASTFSKPAC